MAVMGGNALALPRACTAMAGTKSVLTPATRDKPGQHGLRPP